MTAAKCQIHAQISDVVEVISQILPVYFSQIDCPGRLGRLQHNSVHLHACQPLERTVDLKTPLPFLEPRLKRPKES